MLIVAVAAVCAADLHAHKPVTSKYTYSEDVFPIVKAQCGGCHVAGGIAPMSLMTYEDARPWAESIRLELTSGHMPPWYGDPGAAPLRDVHKLSPRDLDVVLTWVTGGTPPGPVAKLPAALGRRSWPKGRPDIVLPIPAAIALPADKAEDTRDVVLRDDNDRDRMIAFADVLAGNPSIVHDVTIFSRMPGADEAAVIAVWLPGFAPVAPSPGFGFVWHAHEQLVARVHYRKNWRLENKPASDRSTIGLYLATSTSAREIRGLRISTGSTGALSDRVQAIAVRVGGGNVDALMRLDAIRPDGTRLTLAGFQSRAGWNERYWLARPVDLPAGTRFELSPPTANVQIWLDVAAG